MQGPLIDALSPVRQRQQMLFVLKTTLSGLFAGSAVAVLAGLTRLIECCPISGTIGTLCLAAGPVVGFTFGLLWPRRWLDAAHAVDSHYNLKDRSVTALEFVAAPKRTELHELQIRDTLDHLKSIDAKNVVPMRLARPLWVAPVVTVLAIALLLWPLRQAVLDAAPPAPLPNVLASAEQLEDSLKELEQVAEREQSEELKKLVAQLQEKVEELKQPGVDEKEALAKLSEMQAAIQAQQSAFNAQVIDGQLGSLGQAMSVAAALEGAGKALQAGKYEKAVQELEKLEDPKLDRNEKKALEEKLREVAKKAGEVGAGALADAISDLADSLNGGKGSTGKAAKALAKQVSEQAKRKRLNQLLDRELDELKECKCNCESNSLVTGLKRQKSKNPSNSFGMTTSGNVEGEKTNLGGKRKQENITGQAGEGPSDTETTTSPEAREQARRVTQEKYQQYKKLSEEALDSEPIPLGQRQTIRKYFESIRPSNSDAPSKRAAP